MSSTFSQWARWDQAPEFTDRSFTETVDGGQAFRWRPLETLCYEGRWGDNVIRLRKQSERIEYSIPLNSDPSRAVRALNSYFAVETDFAHLTDQLPWRNDVVLKTAIHAFRGLRILRQPFGEALFCFLCSSTKQIPQIKAICDAVAEGLGTTLADGSHGLPTWDQIAEAGEAPLRAAKLGYRARYIHQTAQFLKDNPGWLAATESAPTDVARARLIQLPGVGRKIADCVLLFGAGRLEAFPIDTWIEKILTRAYSLEDWKLPQLQDFARIHYGSSAGFAQQYLFSAARDGIIAS